MCVKRALADHKKPVWFRERKRQAGKNETPGARCQVNALLTFDGVRLGQLRAVFNQSRRERVPGPWVLAGLKPKIDMCA